MLDADLARRRRVEPRDRLVRADIDRTLPPEVLDLLLAEVVAARAARGDHAHRVGVVVLRIELRVVERHLRGGECHVRPPIGLDDQPLVDEVRRVETVDLPGQLRGVLRRVEASDPPDSGAAVRRRLPPVGGAQSGRCDDADAREDDAPPVDGETRHRHGPVSFNSFGRAKIIADWKPPKPLPVESATSMCFLRATLGV